MRQLSGLWREDLPENSHEKKHEGRHFEGDGRTDVLIIGGGLAGVLCAYMLEQIGMNYILVERNTVGSGITANTTAKITAQHGLIYDKLVKSKGKDKAALYLQANELAIEKYSKLCHEPEISCDFERRFSCVYSLAGANPIENEMRALESLGYHPRFTEKTELPFKVDGAVEFPNQAQFNPIKFINGISRNLNIYENTQVNQITAAGAVTQGGKIKADKIIVATHFPFIDRHGAYFLKMYQERSYVIGLTDAYQGQMKGMYVDQAKEGLSFRTYKDATVIGGGSSRTGKDTGGWKQVRQFAAAFYPRSNEKYHWANQDCITLDGMAYIGPYSGMGAFGHRVFTATGFNKWGMTGAMVSAMILSDLVRERDNPFAELFSPSRTMAGKQLFINGFEAAANLLTPTKPRCSHLGCALKWNKNEKTWDCSCHGSSFNEDGSLIEAPAAKNLSKG